MISLSPNALKIGNYSLTQSSLGFSFNGQVRSNSEPGFIQSQGLMNGYASGGRTPTVQNVIDKFSFSTVANATDVGDLTVARADPSGHSSTTHGYTSGGYISAGVHSNVIDKFSFASGGNATDVGDTTLARSSAAGQTSNVHGFTSGGLSAPGSSLVNVIDVFYFSNDLNSTDMGDLSASVRYGASGQSSTDNGYTSGGGTPTITNIIDKFPFASGANASDVGDLSVARAYPSGHSSATHGYASGGYTTASAPGPTNVIDKFPFASNANATDVGDLNANYHLSSGQSSSSSGYVCGGRTSWLGVASATTSKFPFATDTNASDGGFSLSVARFGVTGHQY